MLDAEAAVKNVDNQGKPRGPVTKGVVLDTTGLVDHVGVAGLEGPVNGPAGRLTCDLS